MSTSNSLFHNTIHLLNICLPLLTSETQNIRPCVHEAERSCLAGLAYSISLRIIYGFDLGLPDQSETVS